jgi:restriction system protein
VLIFTEVFVAVPEFQTFLLPSLEFAADGQEHSLGELREHLAARFGLTSEDRSEVLPSGRQRRFDNRVAWAKVYLQRAAAIDSPKRAHFRINERGRSILAQGRSRIDIGFLEQFEEFREFRRAGRQEAGGTDGPESVARPLTNETPEEALERAHQVLRSDLAIAILGKVKGSSPAFFESLVVELLLKMGYGGSRADAGRAIGGSGDEGIDGVISEDRLGLDTIYIQAKRWDGTVGRPEIQKFVGALHGKRARKGVFITTGGFSAEAADYVSRIDPRVVLIDGKQLAEYMIDLDLGVTTRATYDVKRLDSDYFAEEPD